MTDCVRLWPVPELPCHAMIPIPAARTTTIETSTTITVRLMAPVALRVPGF